MMMQTEAYGTTDVRQQIYAFLASLFLQEPTAERMEQNYLQLSLMLEEYGEEPLSMDNKSNVEELRQEYYDRFFVPMSGRYIPPYESVLRNYLTNGRKWGRLMGPEASHVQSCYDLFDFQPTRLDIFEPLKGITFPDHIGFELAFMAYLCMEELESVGRNEGLATKWRDRQEQFLAEHVNPWTDSLVAALTESGEGYYTKVGLIVFNWVADDMKYLRSNSTKVGEWS